MIEYVVAGMLIIGGFFIVWQGLQAMQSKRRVKMKSFERLIFQAMPAEDQVKLNQALGTLRFVYGLFFVVLGVFLLF